jgi:RsiW-degrading membrane proteinase PrsW (M82 family)
MPAETIARLIVILAEILLSVTMIAWLRSHSRRTPPLSWSLILSFLGAGAVVAITSAIIVLRFSFSTAQLMGELSAYAGQLVVFNIVAAASVEEIGKYALGVFLLLSNRSIKRASDIIALLIIAGLGFALLEDMLYLLSPSTEPLYRLLSFYLHAGTSAIIGYSLGRFHVGAAGYREVAGAVIGAIALHASYNLTTRLPDARASLALSVLFTILITVQMFILYRKIVATEEATLPPAPTKKPATQLLNTTWKRRAKLAS